MKVCLTARVLNYSCWQATFLIRNISQATDRLVILSFGSHLKQLKDHKETRNDPQQGVYEPLERPLVRSRVTLRWNNGNYVPEAMGIKQKFLPLYQKIWLFLNSVWSTPNIWSQVSQFNHYFWNRRNPRPCRTNNLSRSRRIPSLTWKSPKLL